MTKELIPKTTIALLAGVSLLTGLIASNADHDLRSTEAAGAVYKYLGNGTEVAKSEAHATDIEIKRDGFVLVTALELGAAGLIGCAIVIGETPAERKDEQGSPARDTTE